MADKNGHELQIGDWVKFRRGDSQLYGGRVSDYARITKHTFYKNYSVYDLDFKGETWCRNPHEVEYASKEDVFLYRLEN